MTRVVAVTMSMGTKWESYSQALVAQQFPRWDRLLVDGRKGWSPTAFIEHALKRDAEYLVHVDEDCFVQSPQAMGEILQAMREQPDLVAAGIPDGGHYYRALNPAALNLFFVVFRMEPLREAWSRRDQWAHTQFREEFARDVMRQFPQLDRSRIDWAGSEPYYPLFWNLLAQGGRFLYLPHELNRTRWSTVVQSPSGRPVAEHLWYLREWFSTRTLPGHDCPNVSRYRSFERELWRRPESGLRFGAMLGAMTTRRIARRLLG
jgi:hypothetical protein